MRNLIKSVIGLLLAMGMIGALARRPVHEARVAPGVKRREAPAPEAVRARMSADRFALHASLWRRGPLGPCGVVAFWGEQPVTASFGAVMCMDGPMTVTRADYRPLVLPRMAESGRVSKVVQIRPGSATVVRMVRTATFKPKRAMFGATELRAAA